MRIGKKLMTKSLVIMFLLLALFTSIAVLHLDLMSPIFAQSTKSEAYKNQHDGGDRAEYEQEVAYSEPRFYVPPVSTSSAP